MDRRVIWIDYDWGQFDDVGDRFRNECNAIVTTYSSVMLALIDAEKVVQPEDTVCVVIDSRTPHEVGTLIAEFKDIIARYGPFEDLSSHIWIRVKWSDVKWKNKLIVLGTYSERYLRDRLLDPSVRVFQKDGLLKQEIFDDFIKAVNKILDM